jgi:hypothetical protein
MGARRGLLGLWRQRMRDFKILVASLASNYNFGRILVNKGTKRTQLMHNSLVLFKKHCFSSHFPIFSTFSIS